MPWHHSFALFSHHQKLRLLKQSLCLKVEERTKTTIITLSELVMLLFLLLRLETNPVELIEFVELDLYLSFNEGRVSLDSLVKRLKALVEALLSNVLAQGYGWLMNCSLDCYVSNFEVGVFHGEELGAAD